MFALFNLGVVELLVLGVLGLAVMVGVCVVLFVVSRSKSKDHRGEDD